MNADDLRVSGRFAMIGAFDQPPARQADAVVDRVLADQAGQAKVACDEAVAQVRARLGHVDGAAGVPVLPVDVIARTAARAALAAVGIEAPR